jgi:hypothetical protein
MPLAPTIGMADTLDLPPALSPAAPVGMLPKRGETMAQVERQFGEPTDRHAPVGGASAVQPPITRWDYPAFSVIFEHRYVVDAVAPSQPPEVFHADQLQQGS